MESASGSQVGNLPEELLLKARRFLSLSDALGLDASGKLFRDERKRIVGERRRMVFEFIHSLDQLCAFSQQVEIISQSKDLISEETFKQIDVEIVFSKGQAKKSSAFPLVWKFNRSIALESQELSNLLATEDYFSIYITAFMRSSLGLGDIAQSRMTPLVERRLVHPLLINLLATQVTDAYATLEANLLFRDDKLDRVENKPFIQKIQSDQQLSSRQAKRRKLF